MYLPLFQEKIDDTTDQRALIIILNGGFHCASISCNLVRLYKAYSHLSRVPYSFVATEANFSDIPIMVILLLLEKVLCGPVLDSGPKQDI